MSRSSKRLYANGLNDSMDASGYESSNDTQSLLGSVTVRTHPSQVGETSVLGAMFIVVNACIGAGLLNFPYAYQSAGGIVVSAIIQVVNIINFNFLNYISHLLHKGVIALLKNMYQY